MNNKITNRYFPDYILPPGETLAELLQEREMTELELANQIGIADKIIKEIIKGKAPITPEIALQLEIIFGTPAHFWNNYEQGYCRLSINF